MPFKITLTLSLALIALAACSPKAASDRNEQPANPAAKIDSAAAAAQTVAAEKAADDAHGEPNKSVPFGSYTKLDYEDQRAVWLTYIVSAHANEPTSDEELLNMFSPRYYNEPDAFKKRELVATELPLVKTSFDKYKAQKYYSLEFSRPQTTTPAINPTLFVSTPYDFAKKSFLVSHGDCLKDNSYGNYQQASITFNTTAANQCQIRIDDLTLAKKIEELRVKNQLGLTGTFYFYVKKIEGNNAKALVTRVHYELYDKSTSPRGETVLASVDA